MTGQQLQHAHVLTHAGADAVPFLQSPTQLPEDRRQLPVAIHVRVVQRGRTALQRRQIMPRIEDLIAGCMASLVRRHDRVRLHDLDTVDVAFDRHALERAVTRHAVTDVVESGELILIDLRLLTDTGVEPMPWQWRRCCTVLLEANADRLRFPAAGAPTVTHTALSKIRVELFQVINPWYWRRPLPLQRLHPVLHDRLLVAPRRQTEQRLEGEVAGQRCVTWIQLPLAAHQQRLSDRLRVVPPDFPGHTPEELERLRHAFQNRLRPLRRQSNRKRSVRVRPHQDQHADLPPTVREVDRDLAEVCFDPLARSMVQRDERLLLRPAMPLHKPPHRVVPAGVALVTQPLEDPHRRVTLLRRLVLIVPENRQNPLVKRTQLRSRLRLPPRIRPRLGLIAPQNLPHPGPRMMKPPGNLPNAHPVTMSPAYLSKVVHRQHPSSPKP